MNHQRGALTAQISRKRKEREDFFLHAFNSNNHNHVRGKQVRPHSSLPQTTSSKLKLKPAEPVSSNRLLAGYMAHEFLAKGTLLGQKFDPVRAQAVAVSAPGSELKKKSSTQPAVSPATKSNGAGELTAKELKMKSYAEVATLLKTNGAHIPGIVNPSQLARWIQM